MNTGRPDASSELAVDPADLAREHGVSGLRIRGFLRQRFPQEAPGKGGRWVLRTEHVEAVRTYFGSFRSQPSSPPPPDAPASAPSAYHDLWYWEGNVQAAIATHLVREGWRIVSVADTARKSRGDDILASRDGTTMRVEVKGWPTQGIYADGRRAGQVKPTRASVQAGHWYSQALLRALRLVQSFPEDEVAIGLPDKPRFRALVDATRTPLERLGIRVLLVSSDGSVSRVPGSAPGAGPRQSV